MSENLVKLIVKVFTWSIMAISVVIALLFFVGYFNEAPFILWAYILTAIATLLSVIFPVIFMFVYPKKAVKTLLGIALIGVVFVIGYVLADSTPIPDISSTPNPDFENEGVLVWSDAGLIATYILSAIAVFALLFTGIKSIFTR